MTTEKNKLNHIIFMILMTRYRPICDKKSSDTHINIAGPEALSLPQTILSTNRWPATKHTKNEASQSHLSTI